jgi:hypothetical protein
VILRNNKNFCIQKIHYQGKKNNNSDATIKKISSYQVEPNQKENPYSHMEKWNNVNLPEFQNSIYMSFKSKSQRNLSVSRKICKIISFN